MLGLLAPGVGMGGGVGITWTTHAVTRVCSDAVSRKLEVNLLATAGTAYARLYNKTNTVEVGNSQVSTASGTLNRQLSSAFSLNPGEEYQIQGGKSSGGGFEIWTAVVVKA